MSVSLHSPNKEFWASDLLQECTEVQRGVFLDIRSREAFFWTSGPERRFSGHLGMAGG